MDYDKLAIESGPMSVALRELVPNIKEDILPLPIDANRIRFGYWGDAPDELHGNVGGTANPSGYARLLAQSDPLGIERDMPYQRYLLNADGTEIPFGPEGNVPVGEGVDFAGTPGYAQHEAMHLHPDLQEMSFDAHHQLIDQLEQYNSGELGKSPVAAGNEYDLGARLIYDPARGHGAEQVAGAAMADPTGGRANYINYRDMQQPGLPELLRKR